MRCGNIRDMMCEYQELFFIDVKRAVDQGRNAHLDIIKLQLIFQCCWNCRDKVGREKIYRRKACSNNLGNFSTLKRKSMRNR